MFKNLNKGGIKVTFVKSETLGTRKVERYLVNVDTKKLLNGQSLPGGTAVPSKLVYTMWMGADHLPYKMAFNMSGMDMQITMTGYNTVGTITPPPAGKIVKSR
jgi:hypothetical protein